MNSTVRFGAALAASLATILAGAGSLASPVHTRAASPIVLNVVMQYPFVDPTVYLNAKTKTSQPQYYLDAQMTDRFFKLFYKTHPGYVINPITTWGWSDALRQKFLITVAGGSAPDVMIGEDFIPELARDGVLTPIPLGATQQGLAQGPLSPGVYNGKVYAVPAFSGVFALYYNRTLMKQAGLDPAKPPTTWDAWLADSKKIAALGNGISGTLVEGNTGLGAAFRLAPFLRQLGGDFMDPTGTKITFNSPANLKALTFLRQLAATSAPGITSLSDEGKFFNNSWYNGKAGFVVNGAWDVGSPNLAKGDFGVEPLPLPAGGHPGNVLVGSMLECVPKLAKHPQAALDFVKLLATPQVSTLIYKYSGYLPTVQSVLDTVIAAGGPKAIFAKDMLNPAVAPLPSYPANAQQIWNEWYNVQVTSLATNGSIAAALATAQSNAEALLQQ